MDIVKLEEHMGSDLTVVNAARVSLRKNSDWEYQFGEGDDAHRISADEYNDLRGVLTDEEFAQHTPVLREADVKLIGYLAKHNHWTPFGHPHFRFWLKQPIFVARQWFRSVVGTVRNEVSRRYVDDAPEFFRPKSWRARPDKSIKQGSGGDLAQQELCFAVLDLAHESAERSYRSLLTIGAAPEQARMVLPQSMFTEFIETSSLAFYARVCKLRLDGHAQSEIRDYAVEIDKGIRPLLPVSWAALLS